MSTTELMPAVEVTAPTTVPYPFGIFSVPPAAVPTGGRFESGVWWPTIGCGQAVGITHGKCNVDDAVPEKDANVLCGYASAAAFTVYARSDESLGGSSIEEKKERARQLLLSGEQFAVERGLWALLLDATTTEDATADSIVEALALAEQYIAMAYGGTPTIHASRYAATNLGFAGGLRVTGAKLLSTLGSQIIAGGGYSDDDLTDPVSVIATGSIVLLRGEVMYLGDHIDPQSNEISAVYERTYVVGWDCTAVRIEVAP